MKNTNRGVRNENYNPGFVSLGEFHHVEVKHRPQKISQRLVLWFITTASMAQEKIMIQKIKLVETLGFTLKYLQWPFEPALNCCRL